MKHVTFVAGAASALALSPSAAAHDVYADDHAPIGVMADHAHKKGEIMFSFRAMHMEMQGNQIGTDSVDADTIATTVPNRFAGMPMQPPTLRIVPTEMRTDMYMLGMMYAPSDAVTLMVMGNYIEKEMDHITFRGGMGTDRLGTFTTNPKGIGDTKVAALFPLMGIPDATQDTRDELTLKAGVSIPTGSTSQTDEILTPMGGTPTVRVPYMMQTGTGTWDLEPALTYKGRRGTMGFGVQATPRAGLMALIAISWGLFRPPIPISKAASEWILSAVSILWPRMAAWPVTGSASKSAHRSIKTSMAHKWRVNGSQRSAGRKAFDIIEGAGAIQCPLLLPTSYCAQPNLYALQTAPFHSQARRLSDPAEWKRAPITKPPHGRVKPGNRVVAGLAHRSGCAGHIG